MKRLILKFGGTSVGTIEKIKKVANIVKERFSKGNEIIVVVSAMSGVTDELKLKSESISKNFDGKSVVKNLLTGDSNNNFLKRFKNLNTEIVLNLDKFLIQYVVLDHKIFHFH